MVWRGTGREKTDAPSRKAAFAQRVQAGVPVGLLGYLDGVPLAWCSIAPRETHQRLGGVADASEDAARVWSLVCFFVHRSLRGQGITQRLIREAVDHAKRNGASAVEAYPVDPDSPSYRFMGFVPSFRAAGFEEAGRAGSRRYVMRLAL
ncbi:MAG: GNAT family N-acetyltransferase [Dehalococcoidia bacterium]